MIDLDKARFMCEKMLEEESISYEKFTGGTICNRIGRLLERPSGCFQIRFGQLFVYMGEYAYLDNY